MQEAESLSLSGSSADDYFCGAMGSWRRQGSDTNLILCIHTELSPPGLAETFANNVIFGGRGGHVEPPSSTSCSSGDHCTSKERCGTDRQTHRHSWEEGDIPPSCCEVLSMAAVSNTQLFRAVECGRRCSRCCSRSRGQEELGGIYLFVMVLPHFFPSHSQRDHIRCDPSKLLAGMKPRVPPAQILLRQPALWAAGAAQGLNPTIPLVMPCRAQSHPPASCCPHLHVLPPERCLFVCWLSVLRPAGKPLLSKY